MWHRLRWAKNTHVTTQAQLWCLLREQYKPLLLVSVLTGIWSNGSWVGIFGYWLWLIQYIFLFVSIYTSAKFITWCIWKSGPLLVFTSKSLSCPVGMLNIYFPSLIFWLLKYKINLFFLFSSRLKFYINAFAMTQLKILLMQLWDIFFLSTYQWQFKIMFWHFLHVLSTFCVVAQFFGEYFIFLLFLLFSNSIRKMRQVKQKMLGAFLP